jgi:uncharacterized repeat protein (TIGR03803 family)
LVEDTSGNLFGTTEGGGANIGGTVFRLTPSGAGYNYTELYSFCLQANCTDGDGPFAGVIEDASGNLYGTTAEGGTNDVSLCESAGFVGCGTVFELMPSGSGYTESVLYNFCSQGGVNCTDGAIPGTSLIEDASGNLYGTTYAGGANSVSACAYDEYLTGCGTVFKLTPSPSGYTESVLYSFCSQTNCDDGFFPRASLIEDASGNLYGTTLGGGATGGGTVFKLTPNGSGYIESVLYSFCSQGGTSCTDGDGPLGALIEDVSGNFYGTTAAGGGGANNNGVVFKLTPSGSGYTESVLYSFCSQGGTTCIDGSGPFAGLIEDTSGNLYGTTLQGGAGNDAGTVFELTPSGSGYAYAALYSFCSQDINCTDGLYPHASLIESASGNLYGTTYQGGAGHDGTVFKLTPTTALTTTSLSLPTSSVAVGASVKMMATVTPAPPNGETVTFYSSQYLGTAPLSSGVATYTNSFLSSAAGSYSIIASYGGDSTYAGSASSAQTLTVTSGGSGGSYTISASPSTLTIVAGSTGTATLTVSPTGGFSSTVNFTCSGLPNEANCGFSPQTVTPSGGQPATTTLSITTTAPTSAALRRAGRGPQTVYALLLPVLALGFMGVMGRKQTWSSTRLLGLIVLFGLAVGMASCGGGGGGGGENSGTPAGSYTVTVTASASGTAAASQTAILTVTVTK